MLINIRNLLQVIHDSKKGYEQSKYGVEGYPTLKWFGKGQDPNLPLMVDSERTKESLNAYIDYQLHGDQPQEPKEPKDSEEDQSTDKSEEEEVEEDL